MVQHASLTHHISDNLGGLPSTQSPKRFVWLASPHQPRQAPGPLPATGQTWTLFKNLSSKDWSKRLPPSIWNSLQAAAKVRPVHPGLKISLMWESKGGQKRCYPLHSLCAICYRNHNRTALKLRKSLWSLSTLGKISLLEFAFRLSQ